MSERLDITEEPTNTSLQELVRALARQAAQEYFNDATVSAKLDSNRDHPSTERPCSGDS